MPSSRFGTFKLKNHISCCPIVKRKSKVQVCTPAKPMRMMIHVCNLVAGLLCGDAMGVCCHGPAHVLAVGQPPRSNENGTNQTPQNCCTRNPKNIPI
eukprot:6379391-Amphidinium_carterae.3